MITKCVTLLAVGCVKETRGQSNLAKAASNVPHTLHAQDSVAVAVPEMCRQSQKLNVGRPGFSQSPDVPRSLRYLFASPCKKLNIKVDLNLEAELVFQRKSIKYCLMFECNSTNHSNRSTVSCYRSLCSLLLSLTRGHMHAGILCVMGAQQFDFVRPLFYCLSIGTHNLLIFCVPAQKYYALWTHGHGTTVYEWHVTHVIWINGTCLLSAEGRGAGVAFRRYAHLWVTTDVLPYSLI